MYRRAAAENKNIDVASLMMQALDKNTARNVVPPGQKRWAYLISVGLPPFGLIFAAKYYFSELDDGKDAAWICITLTAVGILGMILMFKSLLSGSGASFQQIEQIKPSDIQQLVQ
jgi:hypothetical protein